MCEVASKYDEGSSSKWEKVVCSGSNNDWHTRQVIRSGSALGPKSSTSECGSEQPHRG